MILSRTPMVWFVAAVSLLLAATDCAGANIFKCKSKDGGVVVSNTPCARGAEPDAKLSGGTSASSNATVFRTPCERVEATGAGLVQIRSQITAAQARAVDAEDFGRLNSAGASRLLAEIGRNGVLRVCAFFPGGDSTETLIEASGLVRRDGVVDADDPVLAASRPTADAVTQCSAQVEACRKGSSALDFSFERCVHAIPICAAGSADGCCPQACFSAYWKPPFDHALGLAAMKSDADCRRSLIGR
ncbi:MAG: DUF4124 domain-containing protein [Xanthomonadales bacterium]|nr:DUF4124 domain-containing protein [Xanthomonadales bacterium]MCC6561326.1 DUF4124 domain-containing protein [Xanthomonadales bacterium]